MQDRQNLSQQQGELALVCTKSGCFGGSKDKDVVEMEKHFEEKIRQL